MSMLQALLRLALATAALLLVPLVAMQFTSEVTWTASDFAVADGLLFGAGLTYLLVARLGPSRRYRLAVGVAVAAGLLLVWANLAVGLVGSEHHPANLLFGAVPVVALAGAALARFRPLGTARAMWAAAGIYVVVAALALLVWPPAPAVAEPAANLPNVLGGNAVLAAMWLVAGWLFVRAAPAGPAPGQSGA